jgi:hypothetical protein
MRNLIHLFKDVFPDSPLLVAEVISVAGGLAVVEMPGGARAHVRGSATVGQKVFVRDGVIDSVAPDLPVIEIEI